MSTKKKKKGKHNSKTSSIVIIPIAKETEYQCYGVALKMLGDCRFTVYCKDTKERLGVISGKFKSKKRIVPGSVVLLNLCDYQNSKAYVIYIYNEKEIKFLRKNGELGDLLNVLNKGQDIDFGSDYSGSDGDSEHELLQKNIVENIFPHSEDSIDVDNL